MELIFSGGFLKCVNRLDVVFIGAPNATRPSPSLQMRRSDSGSSNSDRSVHLLSPMSPNREDDWVLRDSLF